MPLQATSGAASYDAFGGGVAAVPTYIEDIFGTFLYTGNGPTGQSINNGIDLATEGGLLWCKNRTTGATPHYLFDTARDFSYTNAAVLNTASTAAQEDKGTDYAKPETNGFSFGTGAGSTSPNKSGDAFASWTFRKQPKFFDVVTWTGDGTTGREIPHNLGSVPGCIITKCTSVAGENWNTYHRSLGNQTTVILNGTGAGTNFGSSLFNSTDPTSTVFTLGTSSSINGSGRTFVAYLFAHDAGGFGLTGTDNVISCGSYVGTGAVGNAINLGYEVQWVMIKRTDSDGYDWNMFDVMRGMPLSGGSSRLSANTSAAEITGTTPIVVPTATGFSLEATTAAFNGSGGTYIYIAIRRGPMKVPTDGTKVFDTLLNTGDGTVRNITGLSFPPDLVINGDRDSTAPSSAQSTFDRLRGANNRIKTTKTDAEDVSNGAISAFLMNGYTLGANPPNGSGGGKYAMWSFGRAPGFFDEVCYTGNGSTQTITHNLTVVPELIIAKNRGQAGNNWPVLFNFTSTTLGYGFLNTTTAENNQTYAYVGALASAPTATTFSLVNSSSMNASGYGIVAYLFATCPGVSKVFSFTGNGSTQTINCGFTGGARFVLLKASSATGGWFTYDTARGMTVLTDPYLQLNSTAAETATLGSVTTVSTGFAVNEAITTGVNTNGVTYIGLAIA